MCRVFNFVSLTYVVFKFIYRIALFYFIFFYLLFLLVYFFFGIIFGVGPKAHALGPLGPSLLGPT